MSKDVVLTGLRSNSVLHIGSYLGAILPMVKFQANHSSNYQINMFVPDLHSFTTPIDHSTLYKQTLENLRIFIASGLNIEDPNTFIYRQSYISAHSELAWILGNITYFGELSRMTQFKEKASSTQATAGLFNYPVLMAADILLYDASWVPLGDDQQQHLELARDLAARFNNKYQEVFTLPKEWKDQLKFTHLDNGVRIRSLRNPDKKMSKSIDDPAGTILLTDKPKEAVKKVMSATTDSVGVIDYDWKNQPGVTNLIQMVALLSGENLEKTVEQWKGKANYADLKKRAAELVEAFLIDFQEKLKAVSDRQLLDKLESDEAKMRKVANKKLEKVQLAVGLRPKS